MFSPVFYPYFNGLSMVSFLVKPTCERACPVISWLAFGKLPENPIITPGTTTQVVRPSAVNRYLQSVTVEATA